MLAATGCGNSLAPTSPSVSVLPDDRGEPQHPQGESKLSEGRGVDLRMFPSDPTVTGPRKPTFWIHADAFSFDEKERLWSLESVRAVIYGQKEENEEILLEAGRGQFQESEENEGRGAKLAYLKDGVVAKVGAMRLQLSDIEWVNDEMMAKSDNPLSITTEDSTLDAGGVRLYPDDKRLVLRDAKGTIRFERKQQ